VARLRIGRSVRSAAYFVLACADAGGKVRERSERNNCTATRRPMLVGKPPAPANPLTVAPHLDQARATTKRIGPSGGTVKATAADGTGYTLSIPAGALGFDESITMAPLSSVGGLPMSGGLRGGVDLRPHGLRLIRLATLRIDPPDPIPLAQQDGFSYVGNGAQAHLYPLGRSTSRIEMGLLHFSGYGIGGATSADRDALQNRVPENGEFRQEADAAELIDRLRNGDIDVEEFQDLLAHALIRTFFQHAVPAMQKALSDSGDYYHGQEALQACVAFERQATIAGLGDYEDPHLKVSIPYLNAYCADEGRKVLRKFFEQAYERCIAGVERPFQLRRMGSLIHESSLVGDPDAVLPGNREKLEQCRNLTPSQWIGSISQTATREGHGGGAFQRYEIQLHLAVDVPGSGFGAAYVTDGTFEASYDDMSRNTNSPGCVFVTERHIDAFGPLTYDPGGGHLTRFQLTSPDDFAYVTSTLRTDEVGRGTVTRTGPSCDSPGTDNFQFTGFSWNLFDCPPLLDRPPGPNGIRGRYYVNESKRRIDFACRAVLSESSSDTTIRTNGILRLVTPGLDTPPE
jgi:hypothetical protein